MYISSGFSSHKKTAFFLFACLIFAGNWLIVHYLSNSPSLEIPEWPLGIDVLFLLPLSYLWIYRKQGRQAWMGALALFGFGILFGSFILPKESKQAWLLLEQLRLVVLLGVVLTQATLIFLIIKEIFAKRESHNLDIAVDEAVSHHFGREGFARLMSIEARMWLYALLRKPIKHQFHGEQHFQYHLHQGNASNQQAFLILIGAEIPIAHVILNFYSPTIALFLTAASIYGFIFLLAEYRATLYRPISIDSQKLHIRYGVVGDQTILLSDIAKIKKCEGRIERAALRLRFTGQQHANIHIQLKPDTKLATVFGRKVIDEIFIAVDEPNEFIKAINIRLHANTLL
jgi:hypothetical protein